MIACSSAYIGVYWSARPETRERAAEYISQFIERIGVVNGALSRWYKRGRSRKADSVEIACDPKSISKLLRQNRTDFSKRVVIEELGFNFEARSSWQNASSVFLSTNVGCYAERVSNVVLLDFRHLTRIEIEQLPILLQTAVEVFAPEHGRVSVTQKQADGAFLETPIYSYTQEKGVISGNGN